MAKVGAETAAQSPATGSTVSGATHARRFGLIAGVAVLVLALDQLTKWWALENLREHAVAVFWTLQLNLVHNTGTAFSVGRGTDWGRFVPFLALAVVGVVIWQGRTITTRTGAVAIGMIVGGAIGNLADRLLRTAGGGPLSGGVVDFIDFQWWPVFNVADMGVVVGGFLLVAVSLRQPEGDGAPTPVPGAETGAETGTELEEGVADASSAPTDRTIDRTADSSGA